MNVIQNVHFVFDLMHLSINSFFTKAILANIKLFQQHPVSERSHAALLYCRQNKIKKGRLNIQTAFSIMQTDIYGMLEIGALRLNFHFTA